MVNVNIFISWRLYVLEEIDVLGGIVFDCGENEYKYIILGELNLVDILIVFDGMVEILE